jgi:membrane protein implicated in regulation of membrane protease activity
MGHGRAAARCRVIGFVLAAVTTSTLVGVRILIRGGVWIVVVACVIVAVCVIVAWRRLLHHRHHRALILLLTL